MSQQEQHSTKHENTESEAFDYTHVNSIARIALYDDLLSAPHVTEIQPAPTGEFIENLATNVYQQSKAAGGTIPYTVIREVSENFIHARFQEATVSILDNGCTIRFADQGPGIACKDRAQLPGFTSATEPMKSYIRGVGSGLPIVKEYLDFTHGTISIEDNLGSGSVVTISAHGSKPELPKELELQQSNEEHESTPHEGMVPRYKVAAETEQEWPHQPQAPYAQMPETYAPSYPAQQAQAPLYQQTAAAPYGVMPQYPAQQGYMPPAQTGYAGAYQQPAGYPYGQQQMPAAQQVPQAPLAQAPFNALPVIASLTQREKDFLSIFLSEGIVGVTEMVNLTGVSQSSVHNTLKKLEQEGLLKTTTGKKRMLTNMGVQVAQLL